MRSVRWVHVVVENRVMTDLLALAIAVSAIFGAFGALAWLADH